MDKGLFGSDAFLGLDPTAQTKVAREHFKETLATADTYKLLDQDQRNTVYHNFLKEVLPTPAPKGVISRVVDAVDEFAKDPIGNIIGKHDNSQPIPAKKTQPKPTIQPKPEEPTPKGTTPWDNLMEAKKIDTRLLTNDPAKVKVALEEDQNKKEDTDNKLNQLLGDAPLEDTTLDVAFIGGGAVHGIKGAAEMVAGKVLKNKEMVKHGAKANISGGAFAVGDAAGQVGAVAAMEGTDAAMDKKWKKENPTLAAGLQMGAGLIVGGVAGYKAEMRALTTGQQQIFDAADDIIKSSSATMGVETPKNVKRDETIAKAIADENGAPKVESNPPADSTPANDIDVATKPDVGDTNVVEIAEDPKAKAQEQQAQRVEKALAEGKARKAELEAQLAPKPIIEELQAHPRYDELLQMRRNVSAKSAEYKAIRESDRTVLHENNGGGYETSVIPESDVQNYDYDFSLTKGDVVRIEKGKITPEIEAKLRADLERLDSDPLYAKIDPTPLRDVQIAKAAEVFGEGMAEANMKVIDEIAKAKGVSTDEWLKSTGYDLEDMRHSDYPQFKADIEEADGLFQAAYHGAPHNVDKFTTAKIGTGEGAQAYGHGLYFAGDKEVADWYRNKLSPESDFYINGKKYIPKTEQERFFLRMLGKDSIDKINMTPERQALLDHINEGGGKVEIHRGNLYKVDLKPEDTEMLVWDKPLLEQSNDIKEALIKAGLYNEADFIRYNELKEELNQLDKAGKLDTSDWNKAIAEKRVLNVKLQDWDGESLYYGLTDKLGSDKAASDFLHQNGIRGIKYVDGNSRNLKRYKVELLTSDGEPYAKTQWHDINQAKAYITDREAKGWTTKLSDNTQHNYVIFSDDDIEIIGHNGKMLNGQVDELFQDEKLIKGMVSIGINTKGEMQSTIRLFESADFSTLIHENAHIVESQFDEIERAAYNKAFASFAEGKPRQEAFAEAFVKYLSDGSAPTDELVGAFEKFKNWLVDLWRVVATRESTFKLNDDHIDFMRAIMGNKEAAGRVFGDVKPSKVMNSKADELLQTQQKSAGGFYSAAQRAIEKMPPKMESEAFIKYLKNNGVKDDEILHSGIAKAVEGKTSITKAEIEGEFGNPVMESKVLKSNPIDKTNDYEEARKHFDIDKEVWDSLDVDAKNTYLEAMPTDVGNTKYKRYSTNGGENYREELTTLKGEADVEWKRGLSPKQMDDGSWNLWDTKGEEGWVYHKGFATKEDLINESALDTMLVSSDKALYRSSHWGEPNVLLHTRKQDTIIDGDKTLLIEEIQSDWHQDGRKKGYKSQPKPLSKDALELQELNAKSWSGELTEAEKLRAKELKSIGAGEELVNKINAERQSISAVPQAPMSKTWHEFGMRQIIDEAVTKGYDRVAWVDGATQANRYAMSHSVDRLVYNKNYHVIEGYKDGKSVMYKNADESELEALIGKEPAKRLMENEVHSGIHEIKGEALDIGGDGMKGFYDKILVDYAKKYTKKWGVTVEKKTLPNGVEAHSFPVNAKMKEEIAKNGQPLYVQGGGMLAGVGEDENGNVTFDPIMALAGIAGVSTLMSKSVRGAVSKLAGKAEHLSDATIQGMVRVAIKSVDKVTANGITKIAEKISKSDLVDYVIGHKIYKLEDYMKLREGALRSANAGMENAARLHLQLSELSSEACEAMYVYMSGDKTVALTPELKRAADTFITKIDGMGQEMVDEGFLTKEAYEEWKGQYLHRKYASKIKQASDWASGKGEFSVEKIHMRGKTWNATEDEYQELLKNGEIGKVSEGKIEVLKDTDSGYKLRRDWTPQERKEMGEIRNAAYSLPETVGRLAQMIEFGKMLKGVPAKYLMEQGQYSDAVMKQLGYEKLSGSRYGALNGKWVNHSIAGDLKRVSNDAMGEEGNVKRLWNDYVSAVKMSHTIYNPTAHVNNIGSNVFLQAAGGLNPFKTIKYATDGTIAARRYGRWKELSAKSVSGLGGDEAAELSRLEANSDVSLWKSLDEKKMFGRSQLNEMLRSYMSPSIDTKAGSLSHKVSESMKALYQGEDDVMRFSAIKQLMNDGVWADGSKSVMDVDEAMKHVNDTIVPDYSKPMSKLALTLRDSGLVPFMSWTYYSTPILIKQLRTHPTRVAAIAAGWYGLDRLFGVDPYDDETMPKGFDAQRVAIARDGDKVTGLRVSSMVPHIQLAQPENTFLEPLTSGIPQTILGAATNYNFYFRKPITMKDGTEGTYHQVKNAVQNVLPSPDVLDKAYNLAESKLLDKETRRTDRVFEPRTPTQEAASFFVNLQTYDVSNQRDRMRKDKIKSEKRDEKWSKKVDRAMNKLEKVF